MEDRLEDKIFADAIEAQGIKRTQDMYEESSYPHSCSMCGSYPSGYKLKPQYVEDLGNETPYIFVCKDCLGELGV